MNIMQKPDSMWLFTVLHGLSLLSSLPKKKTIQLMNPHHCPEQKFLFHCGLVLQLGNTTLYSISWLALPLLLLSSFYSKPVSITSSMCPQRKNEFRSVSKSLSHSTARGTIKTEVVRYLRWKTVMPSHKRPLASNKLRSCIMLKCKRYKAI